MGKHTPAPPAPPDYAAAATAQGTANIEAANNGAGLSNPNIVSPYGNQTVTFANNPATGGLQPTVTQTLTPAAQETLDAQQGVQTDLAHLAGQGVNTAQNVLGTPFSPNLPNLATSLPGAGPLNSGPQAGQYGLAQGVGAGPSSQTGLDLSGVAQMPVGPGMTGQQAILSRLEPQLQRNEDAARNRLANQGIAQGSEAYNTDMTQLGQNRNDLESQAALQGINLDMGANQQGFNQALSQGGFFNSALSDNFSRGLAANQASNSAIGQNFGQGATAAGLFNSAQGQGFNQGLQGAQFGNQALQNSLAQQLELRNQPLNEITALMSGSQITNPQFQAYQGQNVQAAPIFQGAQAQGQAALDLYGLQQQAANSNSGGLMGLLGTAAGGFLGGPGGAALGGRLFG